MSAIKADVYFNQNRGRSGACVGSPMVEARKVAPGEKISITIAGGLMAIVRVPEDGWRVSIDGEGYARFVNDEEFARDYTPAAFNPESALPAGATVTAVKKSEKIFVQPWDDSEMGVHAKAEADGYVVTLPANNKPRYMSETAFRETFKNAAAGDAPADQGLYRMNPEKDQAPARFVTVNKDTVFDFKAGAMKAEAGSVLIENPEDEDGFTLIDAATFAKHFIVTKAPATLKILPKQP
jgi:hypothetical protein